MVTVKYFVNFRLILFLTIKQARSLGSTHLLTREKYRATRTKLRREENTGEGARRVARRKETNDTACGRRRRRREV